MSERYRLIFSGEVLKDQHPAVVRKKLGALLKLEGPQLERLFGGDPIVVKKNVDEDTAAKYLGAFRKAGAKLRAQEILEAPADSTSGKKVAEPDAAQPEPPTSDRPEPAEAGAFELLPAGADLLDARDRVEVPAASVPIDHLSLADAGADLGPAAEDPPFITLDIDFDLAAPGTLLLAEAERPAAVAPVEAPNLSVADPGATLEEARKAPPPPAPDTSHLSLHDEG